MTPTENTGLVNDFQTVSYPTRTYKLDVENNRVIGYVDGLKAMEQAIYKILMTPRFRHIIYSFNYGTEHFELIDRLYPYIYSRLRECISEALMQDDRILRVYNFVFKRNKPHGGLLVTFSVDTTEGTLNIENEVK